jgi:hypothetical protein
VKESCRGAPTRVSGKSVGAYGKGLSSNKIGFHTVSGEAIHGGTSGVAVGSPKTATATGIIIPWMECAAVGDKSALIAVPLKSYTSAK